MPKRFEAYGWHVQDLGEDITLERMDAAIAAAGEVTDRPSLIQLRTHIGYGSPNKQDTEKAHGSPLGEDEVRLTKEAYGWDPDAHFLVPDEVLEHYRETAVEQGKQAEAEWNERAEAYRSEHPDLWDELSLAMEGRMPDGWDSDPPRFSPDDGDIATRKASSQVIQWAASKLPHLVSGSADLEPSTLTVIDDGGSVAKGDYTRAQHPLRGARARDGRDRQRAQPARAARLRLDLLQLLRLHEGADAAGRDHGPAVALSSSPTTRSGSERTGRPISRSSSSPTCGPRRTST